MHIGDLMLVTPVLRTLRANFPEAKITLLADKKLRDLVEHNPNLDACMFLDKKGGDNHPVPFFRFLQRVRAQKFDLVINLHRNERASAIAAFSGAKKIVGYSKPGFSLFFHQVVPNKKATMHQIHSHYEILQKVLGLRKLDDRGLELFLTETMEIQANVLWEDAFAVGQKVIAFNIGASWATKRWIPKYFAECADRLIARGYGIAFFGGAMDVSMVADCISMMKEKDSPLLKVFTGKLTLAELAGMLSHAVLMLTTDSGPMHVGVARNVPIVTMFGASPVPGFYPYDARDILIKTPAPCHPCGIHDCPKKGEENMMCMKEITVDAVMQAVDELLATYGKPAMQLARPQAYQCKVVEL